MTDKNGRRYTMILSAILFILSPIGAAMASNLLFLVIFRFLAGIALGMVSTVSPMYISELAPASRRGLFVSFYQLAIVTGSLVAYFTNYLFSALGENNWRFMLGFGAIPGILYLISLIFIPESPKWLMKNNKESQGVNILKKILSETSAQQEISIMRQSVNSDVPADKVALFSGKTGKIVLFGILLAVFQQISGVGAVLNYAPEIFKTIGYGGSSALFQSIIIGLVNFIFTFVAIGLVDRLGRKTLMLGGLVVIVLSLTGLSLKPGATLMVILLFAYVAGFAASIGPVMWVLVSEILPLKVKGPATSMVTLFLWSFTMIVTFLFPIMNKIIGIYMSFAVYALLSALHFLFILFFIPETKGKTLEQIEKEMIN